MAIDKYSGLSQSDKFFARYGKSVGKNAVNRQQTHLALESFKKKATTPLLLPNYAAQPPKQQLRLPNLVGGIYEQATQAATKPKVSDAFVRKILKKIADDPKFNWRAADLKPAQVAAIEEKLAEKAGSLKLPPLKDIVQEQLGNKFNINASSTSEGAKIVGMLPDSKTVSAHTIADGVAGGAKSVPIDPSKLPVPVSGETSLVKVAAEESGKSGGFLNKAWNFLKSSKGKWAMLATAVIGTGIYLLDRHSSKNIPPRPLNETEPIAAPGAHQEHVPAQGSMLADSYKVIEGDNVWNIAKAHLTDLYAASGQPDYQPSDKEVLMHARELMATNNLQYQDDKYTVIIRPEDTLKLTA